MSFENMFLTQVSGQVLLLTPFVPVLNHLLVLLYQHITLTHANKHTHAHTQVHVSLYADSTVEILFRYTSFAQYFFFSEVHVNVATQHKVYLI